MSTRAARGKDRDQGSPAAKQGRRGVVLDSLEALIRARASAARWSAFVEATGLSPIPEAGQTQGSPGYSAYFYALPRGRNGDLYLYGDLRPAPGDRSSGQLRLRWELKPEGPTPQRIKRSSAAVGGWPEVLRRLAAHWPGEKTVTADVTATFVVDAKFHALRSQLGLKAKPSRVSGHDLTQTAAAWRVEPPSGVVQQLSVARARDEELVLVASGQGSLTLEPDMGATLERSLWEGVEAFLVAL